jgi:hypothetical protein
MVQHWILQEVVGGVLAMIGRIVAESPIANPKPALSWVLVGRFNGKAPEQNKTPGMVLGMLWGAFVGWLFAFAVEGYGPSEAGSYALFGWGVGFALVLWVLNRAFAAALGIPKMLEAHGPGAKGEVLLATFVGHMVQGLLLAGAFATMSA